MAVKFTLGSFKLNTTLTEEEEKRIAASMWAGATKKELLEKISEMTISSFRQGIRIELMKDALRQINPYLAAFEMFADPAARERIAKFRDHISKLIEKD